MLILGSLFPSASSSPGAHRILIRMSLSLGLRCDNFLVVSLLRSWTMICTASTLRPILSTKCFHSILSIISGGTPPSLCKCQWVLPAAALPLCPGPGFWVGQWLLVLLAILFLASMGGANTSNVCHGNFFFLILKLGQIFICHMTLW